MSIANPQSFNRYNYVQNDPVNFIDPTGLFCVITGYRYENYEYTNRNGDQVIGQRIYAQVECFLEGDFNPRVPFNPGGPVVWPGGGPRPRKPQPTPQPKTAENSCATISTGVVSVGGIVDSNSQIYPTAGVGWSYPNVPSYSQTKSSGPISPGVYLQGGASSVLSVNLSINLFHPRSGISRDIGYGTPSVGAGIQVVLPKLEGTTKWDWEHHPDNPLRKGLAFPSVGRCPW